MRTYKTILLSLLLCCAGLMQAEPVRIFTTQADGGKLLQYTSTKSNAVASGNVIKLLPADTYQTMDGFGYAITYSSCYNLLKMSKRDREEFLRRTYSTKTGLGVSYARISIGCNDFSSTEYSLCDKQGLENFRLYTDETHYVIPVLKEILAINPDVKIMAAPWSCPKWMKVQDLSSTAVYDNWVGGHLAPKYYEDYAQYFVKFVQAFEKEGIKIYAVTPQNEPLNWGNCASTYMPATEEAAFINKLAPAFKKAGLTTKIYCFDHNWNYDNKSDQNDYPIQVYNNLDGSMEGSELVVGSAWHDYGGQPSELDDINAQAPDKEVIFTEASIGTWNDGRNLSTRLLTDFDRMVYSTVSRQCKAVMVWNLMLDLNRGPNLDGGCQTCYGAVDIDQNDYHTITANSHYYIIAHASAVVQPGAVRIGTSLSSGLSGLKHVAFLNPDGSYAVLILNDGTTAKAISISVKTGLAARCTAPAQSIVSVQIGGDADRVPKIGAETLKLQRRGTYSASLNLTQTADYAQNFLDDGEGWYVDPDFF